MKDLKCPYCDFGRLINARFTFSNHYLPLTCNYCYKVVLLIKKDYERFIISNSKETEIEKSLFDYED